MSNDDPDLDDFDIQIASLSGKHRRPRDQAPRLKFLRRSARVGALVVLAVGIVILVLPRVTQRSIVRITSRSTATAKPIAPIIVIGTDVSYGALTINGASVPFTPNDASHPYTLIQRQNFLVLSAPPFHPITCVIDTTRLIPAQSEERCGIFGISGGLPVLDMNFTVSDLPGSLVLPFYAQASSDLAQLNLATTVPAGAHYALGAAGPQQIAQTFQAATPHTAQVSIKLADPGLNATDSDCAGAICPAMIGASANPTAYFAVRYSIIIGWNYFDAAGNLIGSYFIPGTASSITPTPSSQFAFSPTYDDVTLAYDATTGWHDVAMSPPVFPDQAEQIANGFCQQGEEIADFLARQQSMANVTGTNAGVPSLNGCLFSTDDVAPPLPTDLIDDTAHPWFMVHFGALLAVNPIAHAMVPQLPLATASEVAAAG